MEFNYCINHHILKYLNKLNNRQYVSTCLHNWLFRNSYLYKKPLIEVNYLTIDKYSKIKCMYVYKAYTDVELEMISKQPYVVNIVKLVMYGHIYTYDILTKFINLRKIIIGENDDIPKLPNKIKTIKYVGSKLNNIENIPENLKTIVIPNVKMTNDLIKNLKNIKYLSACFDDNIYTERLPKSLRKLVYKTTGNSIVDFDTFPKGIKYLNISAMSVFNLHTMINLKTLELYGVHYSVTPQIVIPKNVKKFVFNNTSNITNFILPDKLLSLINSGEYTYSRGLRIEELPKTLTTLKWPKHIDVSDNLPNNIKKLSINTRSRLTDKLPNTLNELTLGRSCNNWHEYLPDSIKKLEIQCYIEKPIKKLPKSLKILKLSDDFNENIYDYGNIKELIITTNKIGKITNLPNTLEILDMSKIMSKIMIENNDMTTTIYGGSEIRLSNNPFMMCEHNRMQVRMQCIDIPRYPISLKIIKFQIEYNMSLFDLPDTVEEIIFPTMSEFNRKITRYPKNLKKIVFGSKFNQKLNFCMENSKLEHIEFSSSSKFNKSIDNLPESIKIIRFNSGMSKNYNFNMPIHKLPKNIVELHLPENYTGRLPKLPESLKYLSLGYYNITEIPNNVIWMKIHISRNLRESRLPKSLKHLILGSSIIVGRITRRTKNNRNQR